MDADENGTIDAQMDRIAKGDETAFNRLVADHSAFVHTIAKRFTGNTADADDITQAVFWTVWEKASGWKSGGASLRTWLYRITANRCIDQARRARVRGFLLPWDRKAQSIAAPENGETGVDDKQRLALVLAALDQLPARQRLAIILVVDQELSINEAATAMTTSPGALEQLLVRARRTLRSKLQETEQDHG
ncbi:MAG: sigma-70 family RNA polymerase sigma factor [Pseudomonadota bacterium]